MPPRKKKPTVISAPAEPKPPAYRWNDQTSYSQTVGHRRGEKVPTTFQLVDGNSRSIFSDDIFGGLSIERQMDGAWRITARPALVFLRTDAETAEAAMLTAPYALLIEMRRRVFELEAAVAELDPRLIAKGLL